MSQAGDFPLEADPPPEGASEGRESDSNANANTNAKANANTNTSKNNKIELEKGSKNEMNIEERESSSKRRPRTKTTNNESDQLEDKGRGDKEVESESRAAAEANGNGSWLHNRNRARRSSNTNNSEYASCSTNSTAASSNQRMQHESPLVSPSSSNYQVASHSNRSGGCAATGTGDSGSQTTNCLSLANSQDSSGRRVSGQLAYPHYAKTTFYYLEQDSPPRALCIRIVTNKYPHQTHRRLGQRVRAIN